MLDAFTSQLCMKANTNLLGIHGTPSSCGILETHAANTRFYQVYAAKRCQHKTYISPKMLFDLVVLFILCFSCWRVWTTEQWSRIKFAIESWLYFMLLCITKTSCCMSIFMRFSFAVSSAYNLLRWHFNRTNYLNHFVTG
jgi:hypothetical protein